MRTLPVLTLLGVLLSPAAAQEPDTPRRPDRWKVRADQPDADLGQLFFVEMRPGWHITTGPSVILWDPAATASGNFTIEAEVFFFRQNSRDGEGYGLLLAGNGLDGPEQNYLYFLLRNDGSFTTRHRAGEAVHTIQDWTAHPAIARHTDSTTGATVRNLIRVEAGPDSVRFLINGRPAASYPRSHMKADGIVGLRVNHGLNLHVSRLETGNP